MQRDMSYELDDVFSSRNAGELIDEQHFETKKLRTPGLRVLTPTESHALAHPHDVALPVPTSTPIMDLAGDVNVPFIGPVSTQKLAIGAAVGLGIWLLFFRKS